MNLDQTLYDALVENAYEAADGEGAKLLFLPRAVTIPNMGVTLSQGWYMVLRTASSYLGTIHSYWPADQPTLTDATNVTDAIDAFERRTRTTGHTRAREAFQQLLIRETPATAIAALLSANLVVMAMEILGWDPALADEMQAYLQNPER